MPALDPLSGWTLEAPQWSSAYSLHQDAPLTPGAPRYSPTFRLQNGWTYTDASLPADHPSKTTPRCEVWRYADEPNTYFEAGQRWSFDFWFKPHAPWAPSWWNSPTDQGWTSLLQWQARGGGTPPLQLVNEGSANQLRLWSKKAGKLIWASPMSQFVGVWTNVHAEILFHPTAGEVDWTINGLHVHWLGPTMNPAEPRSIPKVGLYRTARADTQVLSVNNYRYARMA